MEKLKPYVIGVDLGGTNTVFGIVDAEGKILCESSIKTGKYTTAVDFVNAGVACVRPLIEQVGGTQNIQGMGIGAPNANYYTGTIEYAPNLSWAHEGVVPLADMFQKELGISVKMTNDANAAAMGEMMYGAAKGMKNFIVITLGTGVGSGIVINGQLVYGHDGFAGELGHVIMDRSSQGRPCGCGRTGCLEAYCSATGVARTAREILAKTDRPSLLRNKPAEQLESLDVSIAAAQVDEVANEIFQFTGTMLGQACADFAAFSSPEAFIFFGGLCKAGDLIMNPIKEAYDRSVLNIFRRKAQFLVSPLMDKNAAVLGASALGWE
ncbi:MAG: ROK family protein [Bacteroidaceae bacterium]|nr:ROK family protein [Bacteroidaceae bacterium]MBQ9642327.1 ROK family protein [Bacteroidaceae bacterium]